MKKLLKLPFVLATTFVLVACATTESSKGVSDVPVTEKSALPVPEFDQSQSARNRRVGPMDILAISVFGVPELAGDYQVDYQGQL